MTTRGFPDNAKSKDGSNEYATVNPIREQQYGLDVIAHAFTQRIGTDTAETGSTTRVIKATGHAAIKGDVIGFTAGNLDNSEYRVASVETDYITLTELMSEAPANGDAFEILRQRSAVLGGDGSLGVSFTNDTDAGNSGVNTLRVVIATDQTVIPVNDNGSTLSVDDGGGSLTVDGTVAATQSGAWNVTNVSGTVSLPTGAATSARQDSQSTLLATLVGFQERVMIALVSQALSGVTSSAYTQIVALTTGDINWITAFESGGEGLILAVGAAAAEVNQLYIPPGGLPYPVPLYIPVGSRLSIKGLLGSPASGQLVMNLYFNN
jgi:hypothetical protein